MWWRRWYITPVELAALLVRLDPKKARLDTDGDYSAMIDVLRRHGFEPGPLPELVAKVRGIGLDVPDELKAPVTENAPPVITTPLKGRRRQRGPRPEAFERVKEAMAADIRSGERDPFAMLEKTMKETYGASRDTCRKARAALEHRKRTD